MSATEFAIAASDLGRLPRCACDCLGPLTADPAWAAAAEHRWRHCGVGLRSGANIVGYGLVAPAWHRPGGRRPKPRYGGAVLLCLWVDPDNRGRGIGHRVIQGLAAMLVAAETQSLDAVSSRFRPTCGRPSTRFLQRTGFHVVADHPTAPRMRLDLDATVPAFHDLRELWARLTAGVLPEPPAVTAPVVVYPTSPLRGTPPAP